MNLKDKGHKKMTFIFFIFWFFVLKKIFGDEKRGATTTSADFSHSSLTSL